MEKKVILITLIGVLLTIIIYFIINIDKYNFVIIGDSLASGNNVYNIEAFSYGDYYYENNIELISDYNKDYAITNMTTRDLYELIYSNDKQSNNSLTIKQIISNADIMSISIGIDEIHNNQNVKLYLYYLDKVVDEITKINNSQIYLLSLYSESEKITDINNEIKNIAIKHNINYVDISKTFISKNKYDNSYYLNIYGHEEVKNILEDVISK